MLIAHRFDSLRTLIDRVHLLFDYWRHTGWLSPPLDAADLEIARLVVYEWMANFVQHADFGGHAPEIGLRLFPDVDHVRFVIEDNSKGFDFDATSTLPFGNGDALTERGFGLPIVTTCTENMDYRRLGAHWHRLSFDILPGRSPCLDLGGTLRAALRPLPVQAQ